MPGIPEHDYAMERRLREADPALHKRFTDAVFALQYNLSRYKLIFPEYTDHSNLHTLDVIDFCNQLIGDQIDRLNADELYILLTACYLHDTGMGITKKDYREFSKLIDFGDYFENHSRENIPNIIRDFHHEFSSRFIQKYAELLEFPSAEHEWAIRMVARGHRRTNLMDQNEYPLALQMPGGNRVCLPYLAALIRLADEIDVAAGRNPILLYDIETLTDERQIMENKKVKAVRSLQVTEKQFILTVDPAEEEVLKQIGVMVEKMKKTLRGCRVAVNGRTPYVITQEDVVIQKAE
ncbi:MAG: hypothetical protein ABS897_02810 [Eubacteriales bacterium]